MSGKFSSLLKVKKYIESREENILQLDSWIYRDKFYWIMNTIQHTVKLIFVASLLKIINKKLNENLTSANSVFKLLYSWCNDNIFISSLSKSIFFCLSISWILLFAWAASPWAHFNLPLNSSIFWLSIYKGKKRKKELQNM